jgi:hypothetical protein
VLHLFSYFISTSTFLSSFPPNSYPAKGEKYACATALGGSGPLSHSHCCIGSLAPSILKSDEFFQPSYFEAIEADDIPFDTSSFPIELTMPPYTGEYSFPEEPTIVPANPGVSFTVDFQEEDPEDRRRRSLLTTDEATTCPISSNDFNTTASDLAVDDLTEALREFVLSLGDINGTDAVEEFQRQLSAAREFNLRNEEAIKKNITKAEPEPTVDALRAANRRRRSLLAGLPAGADGAPSSSSMRRRRNGLAYFGSAHHEVLQGVIEDMYSYDDSSTDGEDGGEEGESGGSRRGRRSLLATSPALRRRLLPSCPHSQTSW